MTKLSFRFAEENDCGKILYFIKELASYNSLKNNIFLCSLHIVINV